MYLTNYIEDGRNYGEGNFFNHHGSPVDELDTACKAYKTCISCATQKHGETCNVLDTRYRYGFLRDEFFCRNDVGSCQYDICQCDIEFAKERVII